MHSGGYRPSGVKDLDAVLRRGASELGEEGSGGLLLPTQVSAYDDRREGDTRCTS